MEQKIWQKPPFEDQEKMRAELWAIAKRKKLTKNSLGALVGVAPMTLVRFFVKGEDVGWKVYAKLEGYVSRVKEEEAQ